MSEPLSLMLTGAVMMVGGLPMPAMLGLPFSGLGLLAVGIGGALQLAYCCERVIAKVTSNSTALSKDNLLVDSPQPQPTLSISKQECKGACKGTTSVIQTVSGLNNPHKPKRAKHSKNTI